MQRMNDNYKQLHVNKLDNFKEVDKLLAKYNLARKHPQKKGKLRRLNQ